VSGTGTRSLDASTSSGDVTTKLTEAARAITASSGGGTVRLTVPKGAYAVSTSSGGGTTQLDGITIDKTAPRTISASTSSGDIFITGV
jgi:DUF4097 and DUF4098 domain-containing protein YvlB